MEDYKTVRQEMEVLGIEPKLFDTLYNDLLENNGLPSPSGYVVPWEQYTNIVDYLRGKQVLGTDNDVQPDNLILFDNRMKLESLLDTMFFPIDYDRGSSGGVAPCLHDDNAGGIAPCRY
jgi:hypothetical protein